METEALIYVLIVIIAVIASPFIVRYWHRIKRREEQLDFIADLLRIQMEKNGIEVPLSKVEKELLKNNESERKTDYANREFKRQIKDLESKQNYIAPQVREIIE